MTFSSFAACTLRRVFAGPTEGTGPSGVAEQPPKGGRGLVPGGKPALRVVCVETLASDDVEADKTFEDQLINNKRRRLSSARTTKHRYVLRPRVAYEFPEIQLADKCAHTFCPRTPRHKTPS